MAETDSARPRRIDAARAVIASLLGFGYVYIGKIHYAIGLYFLALALLAFAGWTRLILEAWFLYALFPVALGVLAFSVAHPALIAKRHPDIEVKSYNRWWFYVAWMIVTLLVADLIIGARARIFGYETYRTPSQAMSPTLQRGDFFVTDAWVYNEADPSVGDIVVLLEPTSGELRYVKRVAGVPGDTIEFRADVLYRNGERIDEPYREQRSGRQSPWAEQGPTRLGADQYFVLGDFRENSQDSRHFGPIARASILGRAEYVWFSFSEGSVNWERFPSYFD